MKKLIINLSIFFCLLIIIDKSIGYCLKYFQENAIGGDTKRNNYICLQTNEDILIFGSSKALHHYDPTIIEKTLQKSCYNCGNAGNGIILFYGQYKMIRKRYNPTKILYDVTADFDLIQNDNHKYLDLLRPYYSQEGVDSIFLSVDYSEKYKMLSNMYQYNSKFIQIITDNFIPQQSDINGYKPINQKMNYEPILEKDKKNQKGYDTLKLYYLEKLIQECKNKTQLIFIISPQYKKETYKEYQPIISLCKKYNIPLLNHHNDKNFIYNKNYFFDSVHLNKNGATQFSKVIANELKNLE